MLKSRCLSGFLAYRLLYRFIAGLISDSVWAASWEGAFPSLQGFFDTFLVLPDAFSIKDNLLAFSILIWWMTGAKLTAEISALVEALAL